MRIDHLREFIVLAENLNFTQTARSLYITQPLLSNHIASLETELGSTLFLRNRRRVRLTKIGRIFQEEATDVIERYDRAINRVSLAKNGIFSELRIGFIPGLGVKLLPIIEKAFFRNCPDIQTNLFPMEIKALSTALASNMIDIALTFDIDKSLWEFCNVQKIANDHLFLIVAASHPFAHLASVEIKDLDGMSIGLPHPGYSGAFSDYVLGILKNVSVHPSHYYQNTISRAINFKASRAASTELASGLYFDYTGFWEDDSFIIIPVRDDACNLDISALWKESNDGKAIKLYVETINSVVANKIGPISSYDITRNSKE
jgi:DNA-binding transcriptional LysR family regulator